MTSAERFVAGCDENGAFMCAFSGTDLESLIASAQASGCAGWAESPTYPTATTPLVWTWFDAGSEPSET